MTGPLTTIINQSLSTGVFPVIYKHAYVCTLPKPGDPTLASTYRPVSLLPVASKVLEKIVQQQFVQYFASFPEVEALPTVRSTVSGMSSCWPSQLQLGLVALYWRGSVITENQNLSTVSLALCNQVLYLKQMQAEHPIKFEVLHVKISRRPEREHAAPIERNTGTPAQSHSTGLVNR